MWKDTEIFLNKDWKEVKRTRCLVYTRVMGYLSPTYRYNVGKKSEFYSRKYFSKVKAANSDFTDMYWLKSIKNTIAQNA